MTFWTGLIKIIWNEHKNDKRVCCKVRQLIQGSSFSIGIRGNEIPNFCTTKKSMFPNWSMVFYHVAGPAEREGWEKYEENDTNFIWLSKNNLKTKEREDAEVAFCFYESLLLRQMSYELFWKWPYSCSPAYLVGSMWTGLSTRSPWWTGLEHLPLTSFNMTTTVGWIQAKDINVVSHSNGLPLRGSLIDWPLLLDPSRLVKVPQCFEYSADVGKGELKQLYEDSICNYMLFHALKSIFPTSWLLPVTFAISNTFIIFSYILVSTPVRLPSVESLHYSTNLRFWPPMPWDLRSTFVILYTFWWLFPFHSSRTNFNT